MDKNSKTEILSRSVFTRLNDIISREQLKQDNF